MKLCCRVLLLNAFWQILNFGVNMVRVHYSLFCEWYAVDLPDMPTARAFACDFVEFWFEVI